MFLREPDDGIELLQAIGAVIDRGHTVVDELEPGTVLGD